MEIDFARTAEDYARHRIGFPQRFFDCLARAKILRPEARVLDLGTGTGLIARECARRGLEVVGLDKAAPLLKEAARLDMEAGVFVQYIEAAAEDFYLADEQFELVLAGQCWHWFDRPQVLNRIKNLLSPGGHLVIAHFDWLPLFGNVVEATEELILQYSPDWMLGGGTGFYPQWLPELSAMGFQVTETHSFDLEVPYLPEDWRGRIRASAGVAASLSEAEVVRFDLNLQKLLEAKFPQTPLLIPHRVWWVTAVFRDKTAG